LFICSGYARQGDGKSKGSQVPDRSAEALWYAGPGRAEIRPESVAEPGPGEVQVRALHSGVSRGTERLVLAGHVPPSEFERMRTPFMAGAFPFPVKYGYAAVGLVERGPAQLRGCIAFALHPHQSLFNLPADAVTLIPNSVPAVRAVLAANMETALNAIWDAQPAPADRIAVVGAGVVGALVGWLCAQLPAAEVTLVDVEPSREDVARRLGVGFAAPEAAPADCDVVVHASGTAAGLATALNLAGMEATVLELSWYGTEEVAAPLGGAFHSRRLKLISSQVGQVASSHRARWTFKRRLGAALELLADARLDALLEPAIKFQALPSRLPDILKPHSGVLCQVVDYPAAGART
jgi:NADPH:quinone reductase-like Zn-dependent oxidoreductase